MKSLVLENIGDSRRAACFTFLLIAPNILGAINLPTVWGFKIHFFQLAVFLAAFTFGPLGGLFSGLAGSVYTAFLLQNPFIPAGNAILGFSAGWMAARGIHPVSAAALAFLVQLPWLVSTDYFFMGLSPDYISALAVSLALSNLAWGTAAWSLTGSVRRMIST
ncbi:MAG: hypothetical protein PHG91_07135 [Syntrophales bacterium]|nr:hypothetical protein [Syntrophales bacterium]MDD5233152.1 hypothetical protein [Syntrophales bacterium]MDD5531338.1 hypothetical protein [Syntrophales bacterium]